MIYQLSLETTNYSFQSFAVSGCEAEDALAGAVKKHCYECGNNCFSITEKEFWLNWHDAVRLTELAGEDIATQATRDGEVYWVQGVDEHADIETGIDSSIVGEIE